ncbi:MAG: hypothetical protein U1A27_01860 [Phycisphaerae bacterium]
MISVHPVRIGPDWHVVTTMYPARMLLANYSREKLVWDVQLPEGVDFTSLSISCDGRIIVTGYYYTRGVDVWELQTGKHLFRMGPGGMTRVMLDPSARYVALWPGRPRVLLDLVDRTERRFPGIGDVAGAAGRALDGTMLLPTTWRTLVYRLHSKTGEMEKVRVPGMGDVYEMWWSPREDQIIVKDLGGLVSCRSSIESEPLWEHHYEGSELHYNLTYSADGRFVGFSFLSLKQTRVLDVTSGEAVRTIDELASGHPYEGPSIMTSYGKIVNLETGEIDPGASNWRWWRKIGA